jgi:hypothetical protein
MWRRPAPPPSMGILRGEERPAWGLSCRSLHKLRARFSTGWERADWSTKCGPSFGGGYLRFLSLAIRLVRTLLQRPRSREGRKKGAILTITNSGRDLHSFASGWRSTSENPSILLEFRSRYRQDTCNATPFPRAGLCFTLTSCSLFLGSET